MKSKLILTLLICPFVAFAQQSLQVSGHIMDKNTAEALPFATVALLDSGKKLVSGTTTDEAGSFQIALARRDTFYLKVQYVGFQSLDTLLMAKDDRSALNLMLLLAPNTGQLSEVVISSEKSVGSFQMDKQTFNVAKLGNITSGTGLDVLQRLPSVTINAEGKILMRGNAEFLVTVNGKFTNQTAADVLAQLPANTIETIEIITSPSASQDAEGKAGIINIVTKQKTAEGWGITANVNASGKARFGGDFTYFQTKKRFNSFFTANLRRYDIGGYRLGEIRTLVQDTVTYSPSGGDRPTAETIYGIRAGTTFNISKSVSLNGGIYYGYKQNDRIAKLNYRQFSSTAQPLDLYRRFDEQTLERSFYNENLFVRTGHFFTTNTDFTKFFKNRSKIALAAIYEFSVLGGPLRNEDRTAQNGQVILRERSDERSPLNAWRLQTDYTKNLSKNFVFETGYQWRKVHHKGDFDFGRLNLASGIWETDAGFNDSLDLKQTIHAGYVQISGQHKNLQFRAGLRGEQMFRTVTHQRGVNVLNQFDFFPSFQTHWKINAAQEIKVGYSKRIDRPTTKALSPFKNHRHSEAIWVGDPELRPEITHSIEATFTQKFTKGSLGLTAYHNRTSNLIFRVNDSYSRITLLTISTNAGNSRSTGMEAITEWQATEWWRLYFSGNAYLFQLNAIENASRDHAQSVNFNLNANTSFRISERWRIQWNATYLSRTVTAQGNDTDMLLSNIGLKFSISKRWTADLLFQNIFDDNRQRITTQGDNFFSSTEYSKYDRLIQLTLGYRFNEAGKSAKNIKTEYGEKDF
ncbi:MAG: outer membrane beta-barrel family protein [Saprospiraceae bacterium]|nr:outer membrane beta-barrel family protein [Saprospiraceae bacterium]